MIAPEGWPFVAASALLSAAAYAPVSLGLVEPGVAYNAAIGLGILFSVATIFVLWFFRNPEPNVPADADLVVAPGQGKVIRIDEVDEDTFVGGPATKISIFLSVFDVHVQRAPVSGVVEQKIYRPGAYAVAWADKASEINEMGSIGVATENGRVLVRQIAGLIARRILTDPEEGDRVERARRFGLIRFGSRVDLFLPRHWEVLCSVGDRVTVGSTPMARQQPEDIA
ncbi:MAG: phosphatidylserine decarboxylase family protein [Gemmatimonadota bacterium]